MVRKGLGRKIIAWVSIARLQFYPMTWLAYTVGALAQANLSGGLNLSFYLFGYLILFLIEFCTILTNEYFDYETDRLNDNFSMFTGGTRVIVEGRLSFQEVKVGIMFLLVLILILGAYINFIIRPDSRNSMTILIIIGLFLGLGYTMPPLKFSYRGLGEIIVGVTHSIYVILCGYVFQGGSWRDPWPWFISIPLFLAIFTAIILAGLPDRLADAAVGKRSLAVIFGPRRAVLMAIFCAGLAYLSALLLGYFKLITISMSYWNLLVLPHGTILIYFLFTIVKTGDAPKRINREMGLALAYIIWFGAIPLFSLW